ncbi:MAG TPA: alpha/beta hydrolase [Blastocatellia bacterium]|nr:alpha/beta hydrolase [Blastocatellia bacterium]
MRDREYARVGNKSLKLDLYLPQGQGPFPLIIWVHGGGWTSGDKSLSADSPQFRQTARGYAVASINYRLSQEAKFPAQIEDCKAAIRWLRAHATQYNLDPSRIAAWGSSAGGHLVALMGASAGATDLEGDGGNLDYSSRVQAVVDWFGPIDLLKMSVDSLSFPCSLIDHNSVFSPESLLIGCAIQSCPDKTERANPINYVSADDPAFLIMHGTDDCLVGPTQSQRLFNALAAAGVEASLKFIKGAGHGGSEFDNLENRKLVDDFFDRHLLVQAVTIKIMGASVTGKKLFITGENFDSGAVILLDGEKQKTTNDEQNPSTMLIGKKAGKKIAHGQMVTLQVRNRDDRVSEPFSFVRP